LHDYCFSSDRTFSGIHLAFMANMTTHDNSVLVLTRSEADRAPAAATRPRLAEIVRGPAANDLGMRSGAKIMVVDDEPLNVEGLEAFLAAAGYTDVVSTTGAEGVQDRLFNEQPDVVLLDLMTSPFNGFDVLAWMRSERTLRHVPVVILSSAADAKTKLRALELGATDFLAKPVDGSELALRLRNTLAAKVYCDQLAYLDSLTGLPNRERYLDRVDWALRFARRHGTVGAVLQVGLDRFKQINEALGPAIGDQLLRTVALRLQKCVRETDVVLRSGGHNTQTIVSRLGGDEFTVLLPIMERADNAAIVAQRILNMNVVPCKAGSREVFVTSRIGIAVFPADGTSKDTLLKDAGVAMRHAKLDGGGYKFYSKDLNARSIHGLSLEGELRRGIERRELRLHYQRKVDLKTGRLCGAEALVRWQHPTRGLLEPADFIATAEETGLIIELGEWVLAEACSQMRAWRARGLASPRIAVNLSSLQFRQRRLAQTVRDALAEAGIEADALILELTESAIMDSGRDTVHALGELKEIGVGLSVDDFGTGYSSLSRLKRFPLDEIKIDSAFVADITTDRDAAIAIAIIGMGHSLGLVVVAEGVETPEQLAFLRAQSCDVVQGYLFGRPIPPEEFGAHLQTAVMPLCHPLPG
jgi:diguanylate cyclase (GGDEF)-like protein